MRKVSQCLFQLLDSHKALAVQVDLLSKEQGQPLLHLRDRFLQLFPFQDIFCMSARHGAGVPELKQYLLDK